MHPLHCASVSDVIFRLNEQELDRMLDESRPELERLGITIADGSARDALVWAMSFSAERHFGSETQRIATTITLNDEAPLSIQTVGIATRTTLRVAPQPLPWPELRRRGFAEIVEETLARAQRELQVRIGVDYAYEEFARRCDRLLDLIGDDIPNAPILREQVRTWRARAEERTLYARGREFLIRDFDFGHLNDDIASLNEFYETNIHRPMSAAPPPAPPPQKAEPAKPPRFGDDPIARRPAMLDRVAKAAETSGGGEPMNVIGIVLLIVAIAVVVAGIVKMSWPLIGGGALFLLLVVRAMWQWRA